MTQVSVTLNGRSYRLRCGDGEETRLIELAGQVKAKLDELMSEHGNVGDDRLLLMAALMFADEAMDLRAALANASEEAALAEQVATEAAAKARAAELKLAERMLNEGGGKNGRRSGQGERGAA